MTQHDTIRILSDSELLRKLDTLNRRERTITLEILLHLNGVERRKLHLRRGYPSLFRFCTDRLEAERIMGEAHMVQYYRRE